MLASGSLDIPRRSGCPRHCRNCRNRRGRGRPGRGDVLLPFRHDDRLRDHRLGLAPRNLLFLHGIVGSGAARETPQLAEFALLGAYKLDLQR